MPGRLCWGVAEPTGVMHPPSGVRPPTHPPLLWLLAAAALLTTATTAAAGWAAVPVVIAVVFALPAQAPAVGKTVAAAACSAVAAPILPVVC